MTPGRLGQGLLEKVLDLPKSWYYFRAAFRNDVWEVTTVSYLEAQCHQPRVYAAFDTFGARVGYIVIYSVNMI